MSEVFFSSAWYRVAALRPRLRRHAQMHRHHYRGQLWYILQDHAAQRVHRFSPAAYSVIGLMDGQRTVADVWEVASTRLGDDAPTQDEMIQLLTQLHAADVLQCDVLVVCRDPVLETRVTVLEGRVQELRVRYTVEWLKDVSQAEILKEEMR